MGRLLSYTLVFYFVFCYFMHVMSGALMSSISRWCIFRQICSGWVNLQDCCSMKGAIISSINIIRRILSMEISIGGHAVSKDLYHWEKRPIALCPDSIGYLKSGKCGCRREKPFRLGLFVADTFNSLLYLSGRQGSGHISCL